jgi:hypothetical protein
MRSSRAAGTRATSRIHATAHQDKEFPADASSVGAWKGKSAAQIEKEVSWRRGADVCSKGAAGARLFDAGANADDVCQGGLGDCASPHFPARACISLWSR